MSITLKAARVNKGLTQAQAAEKIGVTINVLSNFERGRTLPDAMQIKSIESAYEVRFDDLLFLPTNCG